jgi:hypothetical protein
MLLSIPIPGNSTVRCWGFPEEAFGVTVLVTIAPMWDLSEKSREKTLGLKVPDALSIGEASSREPSLV